MRASFYDNKIFASSCNYTRNNPGRHIMADDISLWLTGESDMIDRVRKTPSNRQENRFFYWDGKDKTNFVVVDF